MSIHTEDKFEAEVCERLAAHGWLYELGSAAGYDPTFALWPQDVADWVKATQPKAWESMLANYGERATQVLAERLRKALDSQGALDVLRHGFDVMGLKHPIVMCQFKPALGMNADLQARYAANRLRAVQQVNYSLHNTNRIDLVLFVNGIPVSTVELKSHYTQSVADAIYQYKTDRLPKFEAKNVPEPLLSFPGGALVHFAVSNSEVAMTTRLAGLDTVFLPFNKGNNGGAGNPTEGGTPTDYLWNEIWQRDSWLEILGRYMVPVKNSKKQLTGWIFPRYHQLRATRRLVAAVSQDGPGAKYLIQHSAGSGKTNSIAWTAHFLADLHDDQQKKVFDSVIVISDRTVLDSQLREAIMAFERTQGVVAVIAGDGASKSRELADALADGKKIVVCTIQTFPFALEKVRDLAATQGKRFAVIADEAHSSQTNETAAKLKVLLSAAEMAELDDGGEISTEDILAAQMAAKAGGDKLAGITYVAFTATPKDKTLQLFGTLPDPTRKPSDDNVPAPFDVYSMRQAIEEGFILDVLQNYTSYKVAFTLAHDGKEIDSTEVDRSTAMKGIMGWVRLHEYNIEQRVKLVVEHFRKHVAALLNGQAKAMVVTGSRKEAVRWQKAIRKYIAEHGYKFDTLVAFSGEVIDLESGPDAYTENSKELNPRLNGQDIRTAFKGGDYSILLVANKFQTGFDEPLLSAMYVDKRLGGIQAVQTLSRLNRCYPGKTQTFIVDFVNDPQEILAAFKKYYETAELAGITDPDIIYQLRAKLDGQCLYDTFEVERVVSVALKGVRARPSELDGALTPVASRLLKAYSQAKFKLTFSGENAKLADSAKDELDALDLFKRDIGTYVRTYGFLSQIFDYGNTDIEKRAIFFRLLLPLLNFGRERTGVDLSALRLTAYSLKDLGEPKLRLGDGEAAKIEPTSAGGTGQVQDKQKVVLQVLIEKVNDLFEGDLTSGDKLVYVNNAIKGKLMENADLVEQALHNTKEQFGNSPDLDRSIEDAVIDTMSAFEEMSKQALEPARRIELKSILLNHAQLYEGLRAAGSSGDTSLTMGYAGTLTTPDSPLFEVKRKRVYIKSDVSPITTDAGETLLNDDVNGTRIDVWFGTDRIQELKPKRPAESFGDDRSAAEDALSYGRARVSIPAKHTDGQIERPTWWRLEFRENPDKHMIVTDVAVLGKDDWVKDAGHAQSEGMLFIHGFNVSFEEALLRTAQLTYDLKFAGVPLCYSWASAAKVVDYLRDSQTVEWSVEHLRRFLEVVASELGLSTIHVIAHSMGNRALTRVLSEWTAGADKAQVGQVVLAAPDVDTGLFRQLVAKFKEVAQVTLYASKTDRAILASKKLHENPRAGDADPPCVLPHVVTVDVSSAGAEMFGLGHSYFAAASTVFTDLYYLIRNVSVDQRKSVRKVPNGEYFVLK